MQGAQGVIISLAIVLTMGWFSKNILKAVDVLYKPNVRSWVKNRKILESKVCSNNVGKDSCPITDFEAGFLPTKSEESNPPPTDDEYLKFLEEELMLLKQIRELKMKSQDKIYRPSKVEEETITAEKEYYYNNEKCEFPDFISLMKTLIFTCDQKEIRESFPEFATVVYSKEL